MTEETTLPKQELLLKLLKKTMAEHDGETLLAIRKANELLTNAGWDWEKLIRGKIVVVEDPFSRIPDVRSGGEIKRPQAPPPTPKQAPPRPTSYDSDQHGWGPVFGNAPPQPTPTTAPHKFAPRIIVGLGTNRFPGFCYVCGTEIAAGWGKFFKPSDFHMSAIDKFRVLCLPCENTAPVCMPFAAPEVRKPRKKSINDLA